MEVHGAQNGLESGFNGRGQNEKEGVSVSVSVLVLPFVREPQIMSQITYSLLRVIRMP